MRVNSSAILHHLLANQSIDTSINNQAHAPNDVTTENLIYPEVWMPNSVSAFLPPRTASSGTRQQSFHILLLCMWLSERACNHCITSSEIRKAVTCAGKRASFDKGSHVMIEWPVSMDSTCKKMLDWTITFVTSELLKGIFSLSVDVCATGLFENLRSWGYYFGIHYFVSPT
jgi:hypothetical protein